MNHFLIASSSHNLSDLPFYLSNAGRYGIHAMELLINKMMKLGARRHDLRAKIFGGASIIYGDGQEVRRFNVGHNNCLFIKDFLANELIPVEAEDLGGNCGRVVHFSNGNFAVYVRKINTGRNIQIARRDQECWNHAIKDQELLMPQEEFWL
jgi:chemotaxis protein CheD